VIVICFPAATLSSTKDQVDEIYQAAMAAGAAGGKLLGAVGDEVTNDRRRCWLVWHSRRPGARCAARPADATLAVDGVTASRCQPEATLIGNARLS
jgi:hypothetical protein